MSHFHFGKDLFRADVFQYLYIFRLINKLNEKFKLKLEWNVLFCFKYVYQGAEPNDVEIVKILSPQVEWIFSVLNISTDKRRSENNTWLCAAILIRLHNLGINYTWDLDCYVALLKTDKFKFLNRFVYNIRTG